LFYGVFLYNRKKNANILIGISLRACFITYEFKSKYSKENGSTNKFINKGIGMSGEKENTITILSEF